MKKLVFMILFAFMGYSWCFGQLNNYKYIIVPTKFDSFKSDNQFRTSTLVKYLFANEGFNTVYNNRLPEELEENPCLGARVRLINESGLFKTKTRLALIDCHGVQVMVSQQAQTKTKDLEQAYREAISESFGSFRGLNYKYEPVDSDEVKTTEPITVSFKDDVKSLESIPEDKTKIEEMKMVSESSEKEEVQVSSELPKAKGKGILYAQPIDGGYQLVDETPKIVYRLKSTSAPDVFLVNKDGKNGVVFKNDGKWFIEMDEKGAKAKELNIKF